MNFLKSFAISFVANLITVMFFIVVAVGITALLEFGFGVSPGLAGVIGIACWYGVRFVIRKHLKRPVPAAVDQDTAVRS